MELTPFVEDLRQELMTAAGTEGDARVLADRLVGAVASMARLSMLELLTVAADEITRDLVPGTVEVRLRGREPEFVVTPPPGTADLESRAPMPTAAPSERGGESLQTSGPDGAVTRINFRLPEQLKGQIEDAAARAGLSTNTWLLRTATAAIEGEAHGGGPGSGPARQYVGWVE